MRADSLEYRRKRKFFDSLLTIFGRKPVLEALRNHELNCFRLHLAKSNKTTQNITEMLELARQRNISIVYHSKQELSYVSKNGRQDQGVALDLIHAGMQHCEDFFQKAPPSYFEFIALDKITNPQNLGMIIRSVCASPISGVIIPKNGCAPLDSLVIKASAGTLFKARILLCENLQEALRLCTNYQATIYGLDANAVTSISEIDNKQSKVFVLGNESQGLSPNIRKLCHTLLSIPMENQVESLNVAVTASLLAFRNVFAV